jgi:hypothetical protein
MAHLGPAVYVGQDPEQGVSNVFCSNWQVMLPLVMALRLVRPSLFFCFAIAAKLAGNRPTGENSVK